MVFDGKIGGNQPIQRTNGLANTGKVVKAETTSKTPIDMTVKMSNVEFTRTDFGNDIAALTGRVKINSPEAQGLPSAQNIRNGQLVSEYHFDNINSLGGEFNPATFDLKYSSAHVPQIAEGTKSACEGFEYAEIASHLQTSPFAELFA